MAIPRAQVRRVLERDGWVCVLQLPGCLREASCFDHRSDRGHGGARSLNELSAGVAACGLCNGRKADAHGRERTELVRRGLIVQKGRTHEHTARRLRLCPVIYPDGRAFWLTDDGDRVPVGPWAAT